LLTPAGLTDILENYAQIVEVKHPKTGKKKRTQVFPRYHQLGVVRQALADVRVHGVGGRRYLIQHSAGSGKSNSIAWLAHQLIGVKRGQGGVFDSVIVITDRRILDDQIQKTIKQFMQVGATVGHAEHSGDLRRFIEQGKKIIVTTVQKFPWVLDEIGAVGDKHFAIVIDEAHSGQGGKTSAAMGKALGEGAAAAGDDEPTRRRRRGERALGSAHGGAQDADQRQLLRLHRHAEEQDAGDVRRAAAARRRGQGQAQALPQLHHEAGHQERFILDVLKNYTPVDSYYKLVKKIEDDPEFDTKKAKKKLRRYVESHDHAIRLKAEIMVDHFHEQVLAAGKIGGQARAMVVTSGIERAIQYFHAFRPTCGAQEPVPGHRRLFGRARVRRRQGQRGVAQRLPEQGHRRQDPGRPVPLPDLRRQVPDRLRRAAAAHDVRGQGAVRHQGGADAVAPEPRPPAEARLLRARLPEQQRDHHAGLPGLLPHHAAGRGDRPEQAARPEGALDGAQVYSPEQVQQFVNAVPGRRRPRQARPDPGRLRGPLHRHARRRPAGGLQGQGQGVLPHLRLPGFGDAGHQCRSGRSCRSC
jgi:hypothetical protein